MKYLVIKDNYVIDTIIWDGVTPYVYPNPHDLLLPDVNQTVGIGDYYEEVDNTFWKQVGELIQPVTTSTDNNTDII